MVVRPPPKAPTVEVSAVVLPVPSERMPPLMVVPPPKVLAVVFESVSVPVPFFVKAPAPPNTPVPPSVQVPLLFTVVDVGATVPVRVMASPAASSRMAALPSAHAAKGPTPPTNQLVSVPAVLQRLLVPATCQV